MQTCETCRYFVAIEGKTATTRDGGTVQTGDCRRYPPKHILNILTASEKEKGKDELVETPTMAKQYASPFYWLVVPEYAAAYDGTNESLWCGEHLEKKDEGTSHDRAIDSRAQREHH